MDAKQYEHLGKSMRIKDNQESLKILKDESIHNMKEALRKDGTTGFLSETAEIKQIQPFEYKGYYCQIFNYSDGYIGFAKPKPAVSLIIIPGVKEKAKATIETIFFPTEHECGKMLKLTVDSLQANK